MHEAAKPAGRAGGVIGGAGLLDQRGQGAGLQLMHYALGGSAVALSWSAIRTWARSFADGVAGCGCLVLIVALPLYFLASKFIEAASHNPRAVILMVLVPAGICAILGACAGYEKDRTAGTSLSGALVGAALGALLAALWIAVAVGSDPAGAPSGPTFPPSPPRF